MTAQQTAPADKFPKVGFSVRRKIARTPPDVIAKYAEFFLPDVCDNIGRMYTMNASIRPLYMPATRLLGSAVTVKCPPGDNMGVREALRMIEPGDVLVIDTQGFTSWCAGGWEMLRIPIEKRGLAGLIVNGAYRDVSQAQAVNFPLYGMAISPATGTKLGPYEINVPVCCGGVIVHPGDIVMADPEGSVVIPGQNAAELADYMLEHTITEYSLEALQKLEVVRGDYAESVFREKGGVLLD
jgi:regulator of RNase E activity RraA